VTPDIKLTVKQSDAAWAAFFVFFVTLRRSTLARLNLSRSVADRAFQLSCIQSSWNDLSKPGTGSLSSCSCYLQLRLEWVCHPHLNGQRAKLTALSTGWIHSKGWLYFCRVLLGFCVPGIVPIMLTTCMHWYSRYQTAFRWVCQSDWQRNQG
jgi:hypothetical protein